MSLLTSLNSPIETPTDAHIAAVAGEAATRSGNLSTMDESLSAAAAITANTVYLASLNIAIRSGPYTELHHLLGATVSGNVAAGFYTYDGTTFTRIANSGIVAVGTLNTEQTMTMLAAASPNHDDRVFAAFVASAAIFTHYRGITTPAAVGMGRAYMKAAAWDATDGLPATITSAAAADKIILQIVK